MLRRVAAAICFACVYEAALSRFSLVWVILLVASAMVLASEPAHWLPTRPLPQTLAWPSISTLLLGFVPGWLLMAGTGVGRAYSAPPRVLIASWVAGLLWVLGAAVWAGRRGSPRGVTQERRYAVWLWGLLIFACAAVLRLWWLSTATRDVHIDEQFKTGMALRFFADPERDWFGGDILMNVGYAISGAGTLLFDLSLGSARLASAVCGIASVMLLFDALRRVATLRVAVIGGLLLAVNHVHIAYSRLASEYIQPAFVVSLMLALAARLWTAPTYVSAVLLAVVAAVGMHTAPASPVLLPLLALACGVLLALNPGHERALRAAALIAVLTGATALAPLGVGMWQNRGSLFSRSGDVNIFVPRVLESFKRRYQTDSGAEVIARSLWGGLTGFQNGRNWQPQYATAEPMADPYAAALMIPGLVFVLFRPRSFVAVSAVVFASGNLLLGLGMNQEQGFQRATGAIPPAAALMAVGLVQLGYALYSGPRRPLRLARDALLATFVALSLATNLRFYFVECITVFGFGDNGPEVAWTARELAHDYRVHIADWYGPTSEIADLILAGVPVLYKTVDDPVAYVKTVDATERDVFVLKQDNSEAREALLARFPQARLELRRRFPDSGPAVQVIFIGPAARSGPETTAIFLNGEPFGLVQRDGNRWSYEQGAVKASLERGGEGGPYPRHVTTTARVLSTSLEAREEYELLAPPAPIEIEGLGLEVPGDPPGKNVIEHERLSAWLMGQALPRDTRDFERIHAEEVGRELRVWYEISGRRRDGRITSGDRTARFDGMFQKGGDGWVIHHRREPFYHRQSLNRVDVISAPEGSDASSLISTQCGCYGWAIGGDQVMVGSRLYHAHVDWVDHAAGTGLYPGLRRRPTFPWFDFSDQPYVERLGRRAGRYRVTDAQDKLIADIDLHREAVSSSTESQAATYDVRLLSSGDSLQPLAHIEYRPGRLDLDLPAAPSAHDWAGIKPEIDRLDALLAAMPTQVERGDGIRDSFLGHAETLIDWVRLGQEPSDETLADVVSDVDALTAVSKVETLLDSMGERFVPRQ